MDTPPAFTSDQLVVHIIGEIANVLAERPGQTQAARAIRHAAATHTIGTFGPADAIEAMLAGHCLLFHDIIMSAVPTTGNEHPEATRRTTRGSIVAMDRAFGANLTRLAQYRAATGHDAPELQAGQPPAERDIMERAARHQAARVSHAIGLALVPAASATRLVPPAATTDAASVRMAAPVPASPAPYASASPGTPTTAALPAGPSAASARPLANGWQPSAEMVATCRANPEAMAALEAADPARFARAMGVDKPAAGYIAAAAAQMAGFNAGAAAGPAPIHPGNRQARRHPGS